MDRDQVLFRLFGKYCPEGTILYTEGAPGEDAFLVRSGRVRLAPPREDAAGEVGPGGVLGEEAFFTRTARRGRAEILEGARLLQVGDRSLDSFVRHGPEEAGLLLERLLALGARARGAVDAWTLGHLARRAAPLLRDAAAAAVRVEELAECAGVGPSGARRLLGELTNRGAVAVEGDAFRAPDAAALERAIAGLTGERG